MTNESIMQGIELPEYPEQLEEINKIIIKYKKRLSYYTMVKLLTKKEYIQFHDTIVRVLEYLGDLSTPAFNICDELETRYFKIYKKSPELAKKLWLDHYHQIHKPYNTLKNRCFNMLDKLNEIYFKLNKIPPPKDYY